ncbi:MAG: sensor histidine kinase [Lunatimonas sp.]|uniref:7TM diverse intracellular signaling domain-containing protein n=1 Tax=Lunatimonas sp. TaxID=2060141 RepID=UPI00263B0599|nr:7TM diverse intracellular signaling domain-containing protein [Lunatimonas sp.]MCC5938998.1 sensor histidine kinase [Lunatimonas sp.]
MKKKYSNFLNTGLTLVLILLVIVPTFYLLGVFGSGEGMTFQQYNYFFGRVNESGKFDAGDFDRQLDSKVSLGVIQGPLSVLVDLGELDGLKGDSEYFIEFSNSDIRQATMYFVDTDGNYRFAGRSGTLLPEENDLRSPNLYFRLHTGFEQSDYLVFEIHSVMPVEFSINVYENRVFLENNSKRTVIISVYAGIMVALFLYNLILFFSILDKVYLFYCFYILFIGLAQLSLSGYSFFILGHNAYLYEVSMVGFTALSSIFVIPFFQLFLKTSLYVPKIGKYLYVIVVFYFVAFFLRLLGLVEVSYSIVDVSGLLLVVAFFSIGGYVASKGDRSAYFFLLAWTFLLVGLALLILNNQGVIDLGAYANLPMLSGTAIEALLLSFALADKINILKKEKEKEQHDKLEALKENERLIKEQNVYLEDMVKSRTKELEQTLKNLKDTQTQLVNQEKMASLGQLTAGIAHEINNPINFVSSNISPLKRDIKDILELMDLYREKGELEFSESSKSEVKDLEEDLELDYLLDEVNQLLAGMEDGAKRTVEIVRGLKLFSRIDEQDVKEVDIHDGLESTLILLNSSMAGRIAIKKEYSELPQVECLAGKINQVFMNIISNAIHAMLDHPMEGKSPQLTLKTSHVSDQVVIEIGDNGPGMPEHVREKIFEPFFTTKPVGKGTGLGLSIVYTIIENHKGSIVVESSPDRGTNFIITLPIKQN